MSASLTTPQAMERDKVRADISMTSVERVIHALELSDFALAIRKDRDIPKEAPSSIQWIDLRKTYSKS